MIKHIELENFKCHRRFEDNLSQITILTGGNSAGKSSIIQAILFAVKSFHNISKRYVKTNDIYGLNLGLPGSIISENFEGQEMKIILYMQDYGTNIYNVTCCLDDIDETSFRLCNCDEMLKALEVPVSILKTGIYYLNAERTGPRIVYGMNSECNDYVGTYGEYTGYIISEMDKRQRLDPRLSLPGSLKISPISRFSANCEEWLQLVIPETSLQYMVDTEKNMSMIKFKNSGDYYFPTATGFGISYVLPVIVQALLASMGENSILLVENPEAHLHPYSQSAIGKFLAYIAAAGVQVIMETHSGTCY